MNSRPCKIPAWQLRRQRLLHGLCLFIESSFIEGKRALATYRRAAARWNRSKLARDRGRHLSASGIRAIWATWKRHPSIEAFAPKWKSPDHRKITPAQAVRWARRIISQRITVAELYRRLLAEKGALTFCRATLCSALPSAALRAVDRARVNLEKAERAALAILDGQGEGSGMNSDQKEPEPEFRLPDGREAFRVWEVATIIGHTDQQVNDLIALGKFGKVINCGKGKVKGSRVIPRAGLVKFLRENSQ